ncbi:MAG: HAD-IIB family hydrolase [Burkholderia gladioli]
MQALSSAPHDVFAALRFVLTDMDETLTWRGRLAAATYDALERLQAGGIRVVPVTAAPAGWCDQMARMWPVDGVIGENGGLFIRRDAAGARRSYPLLPDGIDAVRERLQAIAARVAAEVPEARLADDQAFRLTSLAYQRTGTALDARIVDALARAGADTTINNLWVLGWTGGYDKRSTSLAVLAQEFGVDADSALRVVGYSGDSTNDAPMFAHFRHTVGVSTVVESLPSLPVPPAWVTAGPGGAGFVEFADAILRSRA